ncbi:MAG: acetoacetate--CoA ligase, partial [Pseudomonadales bacterium]
MPADEPSLSGTPLWLPDPAAQANTHLAHFRSALGAVHGLKLPNYPMLHAWSVAEPAAFWEALSDYAGVRYRRPAHSIVEDGDAFPGARWFPGAQLNFAENLLRYRDHKPALVSITESGQRTELDYATLYARVYALSEALRERGVAPGDRIAGWLPNAEAAVIAMLASTALGAVWSSCSPDFGEQAAIDRFGQIEPVLLFGCDSYEYAGKNHATRSKVKAVAQAIGSIREVIWVSPTAGLANADSDFEQLSIARDGEIAFHPCDFSDPLYIMYSSGTTGVPKCIVHGVGGTLLQHQKEHLLHVDLHREDRLFFFTTCGWMMWNWLVSALACGNSLVLYDGSPFHPGPERLMDLAQDEGITQFGISAKYLSAIDKAGLTPASSHDLSAMRLLLSTGSPLTHEGFRYVYDKVHPTVQLVSMSGGTDILSCFVLGHPAAPIFAGEIPAAGLGMAVDVWNDAGVPVMAQKGELVCTQPFPSAPLGFWNDADGSRYHKAYFAQFEGAWAQGDFAERTANGGFIIYGRSDAILNPGGVRIGTAEIYRQVDAFSEITDAVCIGQDWQGDVRVVLFVTMAAGQALSDSLVTRL